MADPARVSTTSAPAEKATAVGGETIELEEVTKQYPSETTPAVDRVSLRIPAGEIVVLVGPSGCGKTTTMKMINRLIEPTSGRITIGGTDVLSLDVDEHRRAVGYVIQQIGLFPHMRVAENIGLVPRVLGWNRKRVNARTEQLLDLVGLPPEYAKRYPRELSGGQQQRVGVARALAADPPVMLMDEPFGATDPIIRERLQNEFLRLQHDIRKTIVFVTHDFDEALKVGDRIAVLRPQSVIAQFDTPAAILAAPADDYVKTFIGAGGHLKRLGLMRVRDADLVPGHATDELPVIRADAMLRDALDMMLGGSSDSVFVTEDGSRSSPALGVLHLPDLMSAVRPEPDAVEQQENPHEGSA